MYKFFLIFLMLISMTEVFAQREIVTHSPYYTHPYANPYLYRNNRPYGYYPYGRTNYTELNALEQYTFNRNYYNENNLNRLQRLEMAAFGTIQQGDFDRRYENVRAAILSRPRNENNNSIWKNIGNYFAGQMTGFTPPMVQNSYSSNMPHYYGNSSFTEYSNPWGKSIRTNNYGNTSGSSITILD